MALSVKLDARLDQKLRNLALEMNCSRHFLMCEAIRTFVEAEEMKRLLAREQASPDDHNRRLT